MDEYIIGEYINDLNHARETLFKISLNPEYMQKCWDRCGLLSNFGSFYLTVGMENHKNIVNSISVIMNELLENAVKYSEKNDSIDVFINQKSGVLIIELQNTINDENYKILLNYEEVFLNKSIADEKYFEVLRSNSHEKKKSGIGLLTIMNVFNSKISCKFFKSENKIVFAIQSKVNIKEL